MSIRHYKRVVFDPPKAIRFIPGTEWSFVVVRNDGTDEDYVCSFRPGDLATTHCFIARRTATVKAASEGRPVHVVPVGISANTRIVSALVSVCFPRGVAPADFDRLASAVESGETLELPSALAASVSVNSHAGIAFDDYAFLKDMCARQGLYEGELQAALASGEITQDMLP